MDYSPTLPIVQILKYSCFLYFSPNVLIIYQKSKSYTSYFFIGWSRNSKYSNFEQDRTKLHILNEGNVTPKGVKISSGVGGTKCSYHKFCDQSKCNPTKRKS